MLELITKIAYGLVGLSLACFMIMVQFVRFALQFLRNPSGVNYVKPRPDPPAVLDHWNHGYAHLPSGQKIHYVFDGPQDKPLMLFVHGFPEFWYSWRSQLKEFKSEYRVVAMDMRGYGDSDKPGAVADYKINFLVEDVKDLVKALGFSSCTLVAHDWGGAVAWQVAARFPEVVDKFIVCNCPHPAAFRKYLNTKPQQMLKSWYMFFFQCPYLPEAWIRAFDLKAFDDLFTNPKAGGCRNPNAFNEDDIEAFKYTFGKPGALTPPINYYRAAFGIGPDPNARKPTDSPTPGGAGDHRSRKVQPPTLIIWGTDDVALSTAMASMSTELCESAVVKYVDGASHWVQQDEPKVVNQIMWGFLRGSAN